MGEQQILTAKLAHELRNPIFSIHSGLELLSIVIRNIREKQCNNAEKDFERMAPARFSTVCFRYNPGTSPSNNIPLLMSLACTQQKLLPEEAFNGVTINGACAMEIENKVGSISIGKIANLIITKEIPSLAYLPYSFGERQVKSVLVRGKVVT